MKNKKWKWGQMFGSVCLAIISFASCSHNTTTGVNSSYAKASDVEFWTTYSTDKIMQDKVEGYEEMKLPAVINVSAIGGEEEAFQLIMTAGNKPVKEYNATWTDLSDGNGNVLEKENVKIYHEKYLFLPTATEYYTEPGRYPDCLVPFDRVKEAKETGFKANNNQGLYVSFKVPEEQSAGIYTGTLTITIGGEDKTIPLQLEVVDAFIGVETHAKSVFLNDWSWRRGELNTTEEMYDRYNEMLFEYRLGINSPVAYANQDDFDFWVEKAIEYVNNPKCPTFSVPWVLRDYSGNNSVEFRGRTLDVPYGYDYEDMIKRFRVLYQAGKESNVNPFEKMVVYGFDEPDLQLGSAQTDIHIKEWGFIVKQCKLIVAEEIEADTTFENAELKQAMLNSLRNKNHHLMIASPRDSIVFEEEDVILCPGFHALETQTQRDQFRLFPENDLWWYGCVNPDYPFPTYHIDDTAVSARLESWMKADYDIIGNLYWATTLYTFSLENGDTSVLLEDLYEGTAQRCLSTNGEGFLFYPGAKYGVYGPLPSIRLEQIRDGLEEYEMIYKMADIYEEVSEMIGTPFTEDAIMRFLYDSMYTDAKINTTHENFAFNRSQLLKLFELACSDAKVCVMSAEMQGTSYEFEVFAANDYTVKQAGQSITNVRSVKNGKVYTILVPVQKGSNLDISVEVGAKTLRYVQSLGSGASDYKAEYLYDNNAIQERLVSVDTALVDGTSVNANATAGEKYIHLTLGEATQAAQDFILRDDNVIKKLGVEDDKLVIRLYNTSDQVIQLEILMDYGQQVGQYYRAMQVELKPGENTITIGNLSGYNWKKRKYINSIRFIIGAKGDKARDCLYFINFTVYKK